MKAKGIVVEGADGTDDLLGFGRTADGHAERPTLSRREADGALRLLAGTRVASVVARTRLGLAPEPHLRAPGRGREGFPWMARGQALAALPTLPSWPMWSRLAQRPGGLDSRRPDPQ